MQRKTYTIVHRTLLIFYGLLVTLLILALLIPLSYGSAEAYIGQASLQLARSNALAKNALILEYGPAESQAQAQSDLQVALPLFVGEENKILRNKNTGVQDILQEAQSNYLALVVATTAIINHPAIDPRQVAIIVENSRAYNTIMNRYLDALAQQANDFNAHLVLFQEIILGCIVGCSIGIYMLHMQRMKQLAGMNR